MSWRAVLSRQLFLPPSSATLGEPSVDDYEERARAQLQYVELKLETEPALPRDERRHQHTPCASVDASPAAAAASTTPQLMTPPSPSSAGHSSPSSWTTANALEYNTATAATAAATALVDAHRSLLMEKEEVLKLREALLKKEQELETGKKLVEGFIDMSTSLQAQRSRTETALLMHMRQQVAAYTMRERIQAAQAVAVKRQAMTVTHEVRQVLQKRLEAEALSLKHELKGVLTGEKKVERVLKELEEALSAEAAKEEKRAARDREKLEKLMAEGDELDARMKAEELKFDKGPAPWAVAEGWVQPGVTYVVDYSIRDSDSFDSIVLKGNTRNPSRYSGSTFMIRERPFAKGTFRLAYYAQFDGTRYVAKSLIARGSDAQEKTQITETAKQYELAALLTRKFVTRLHEARELSDLTMQFIRTFVVKLADGRRIMMEEYHSTTTFKKWNNNWCYFLDGEPLPQALSHFTYEYTKCRYIYVDVQGFVEMRGGRKTYILTDPAFHSDDTRGVESLGSGDCFRKGIDEFFSVHTCNMYCIMLGLPSRRR